MGARDGEIKIIKHTMTAINNTTDKNGIIQICESLGGYGDGGITNNTTLLKQFINYANIAIAEVRSHLLKVDRSWKADDYNYTDVPDAPISFVASQFDYELPVSATGQNNATLLRVNYVYYISGTERVYLSPMDARQQYNATAIGTPTAYYFNGKSIYFDIAPDTAFIADVTQFHVDFSRLDDPFISTDTTQQPGFLGTYHHIIAYKMVSLDRLKTDAPYALRLSSGNMDNPGMFESGIKELQSGYARMNGDRRVKFTPKITSFI